MSLQEPSQNFSAPHSPNNSSRKRPASERKLQANRKNALRSTGPKTARGKQSVGLNAIKHGLLSREVVITAGDGKESLEEFHALVERLGEYYEPVGVVEEMFVQRIANCWWKLARATRAENGEVRKRLDTLKMDGQLQNSDKGSLALMSLERDLRLWGAWNPADGRVPRGWSSAMQDVQSKMRRHGSGLEHLRLLLQWAKMEMEDEGYIAEHLRKKIYSMFCFWDFEFAAACRDACPPDPKMEDRPSEDVMDKETIEERPDVVAFIDRQLEKISFLEEHALEREKLAEDAEARSFSLPPADATDKLLRYEAHLDRQLYRAMDQLERLQRQRSGENVPPPLNINFKKS